MHLGELQHRQPDAEIRAKQTGPRTAGENEQLTALWCEALRASGYVNPLTAQSTEEKLRRMIRRWNITARDAPVTLGMLRQILWKLGNGGA